MNERLAKTASQTLSGNFGQYLGMSDIVQLEISGSSKLQGAHCLGQVGHCPVGQNIVR
jgi:hypothetical protein